MARKTFVMFVLDASGSMERWSKEAQEVYNKTLESIRERSRIEGLDTKVGLVQFNDVAWTVKNVEPVAAQSQLAGFRGNGNTALWDAVEFGITRLAQVPSVAEVVFEDVAFLVIVVTDGQENASRVTLAAKLSQRIRDLQATAKWTFAFNVSPGDKHRIINDLGVPEDNVREWEATQRGFAETRDVGAASTASYLSARAAGKTQVTQMYKVETDLSGVTKKDLSALADLSGRMKLIAVPKEEAIKAFVEARTGKPYVIGGTYYQLTKKEKVQPSKNVLIKEKSGKRIFGGTEARELIGLPTDGTSQAEVKPGNHANFDVFVQSKTVNRKLVRGTHVVIDTTKQTQDTPTWDHTLGGTR